VASFKLPNSKGTGRRSRCHPLLIKWDLLLETMASFPYSNKPWDMIPKSYPLRRSYIGSQLIWKVELLQEREKDQRLGWKCLGIQLSWTLDAACGKLEIPNTLYFLPHSRKDQGHRKGKSLDGVKGIPPMSSVSKQARHSTALHWPPLGLRQAKSRGIVPIFC